MVSTNDVVKNIDGTHTFCVDFCCLNYVPVKVSHAFPLVDTLDRHSGAKVFSTIDLTAGY